jgi:hypothetical protein
MASAHARAVAVGHGRLLGAWWQDDQLYQALDIDVGQSGRDRPVIALARSGRRAGSEQDAVPTRRGSNAAGRGRGRG